MADSPTLRARSASHWRRRHGQWAVSARGASDGGGDGGDGGRDVRASGRVVAT